MDLNSMLTTAGCLALGAFMWTFAEYALHNWWGHVRANKNHFSRQHLRHHAEVDWFAPTREKLAAALKITVVLVPAGVWLIGYEYTLPFVTGFLLMYLGYELVHRRAHTHAPRGVYGRWSRRHHFYHHFKAPHHNHGVTTPIWDVVFRTYRSPGKIRVPAKNPMSWLLDPATGDVWEHLQGDYELGRASKRTKRRAGGVLEDAAAPKREATAPQEATAQAA